MRARIAGAALGLTGAALLLAVAVRQARRAAPYIPDADLVAAARDRALPLHGGVNVRDIGGYHTADGHQVRTGLIYRSGELARLSDDDLRLLAGRGLRLVCDLRTDQEVLLAPDRLPPGVAYERMPFMDAVRVRGGLRTVLFERHRLPALVLEGYTHLMIDQRADVFGRLLRRLAEPGSLPAIVHCTAGKDRTGLSVALLLLALGVPEATVMLDYTLSNAHYDLFARQAERRIGRLKWIGLRASDLHALLVADGELLRATLAHIHTTYGSVLDYLRGPAGVDDATIATLRARLLV